jgi:hypothetical protein
MHNKEALAARLEDLKKARDRHLGEANFLAGQVALLEELLAAEVKPNEEDVKV